MRNNEPLITGIFVGICVIFAGYWWFILARWLFRLLMQ
jgi:hypothetical protein